MFLRGLLNFRQEKNDKLEQKINQLCVDIVHLEAIITDYDEEVGILKASATNMLKRFELFLGKGEAEHPTSEKVEVDSVNITERLSELMEKLELQKLQVCNVMNRLY